MRSLYSGVAGLKTHQTKMDVIGNNIANVNTVAFKSTSVNFNEIYYQTTQGASGPNANTGAGGVNAKQIGLGVAMASTMVNIKQAGATQTTGGAFDIKINGDSFFIVNDGTKNMFTRAGSFYVDAAGNLAMTSTGYNVMGWQVDEETGLIKKDTVSALRIMSAKNMTSAPEATQKAVATGVLDANSKATKTDQGYIMNLNFYDDLGYQYTAKFKVTESGTDHIYNVCLTDVLDSNSKTVITGQHTAGELFGVADPTANDSGALLAGKKFIDPTKNEKYGGAKTWQNFINKLNNTNTQDAELDLATAADATSGLVVIGANGDAVTKVKVTKTDGTEAEEDLVLTPYYVLKESNEKMVEGGYYFTDQNGKFYALHETKTDTDGKVTMMKFVALDNSQDDYANTVSSEKFRLREFYADNFAGIDPDIYIDGSSKASDATSYYDTLTIGQYSFKTVSPYRLSIDTNGKYTLTKDGAEIAKELTPAQLQNYLVDPEIFSTTASTKVITDLLAPYKTADKFPDGVATLKADCYDTYVAGITGTSYYNQVEYDAGDGTFVSIGKADSAVLAMSNLGPQFKNISIDFTQTTNYNNGGSSTLGMDRGDKDGKDAGKKLGAMTGISIDKDGMVFGSYDNGNTVLLAQIAVANFANASGLEKVGENCYQTTLNSGEFDGIGVEIGANGGSMTTGALEMSNVDLSNEFTDMITTQRGFQANSRIITTSDTLLEELINLKR